MFFKHKEVILFFRHVHFFSRRVKLVTALFFLMSFGKLAAAPLLNFNMQVSDVTPGAIATYTFSYTTVTALTTSDAVAYALFPTGFVTPVGCGNVVVTINGNMVSCDSNFNGQYVKITSAVASGDNVVVTYNNITNASSAGIKTFRWMRTANGGGNEIDGVNPAPRVTLVTPNSAPQITGVPIVTTISDNLTVVPFNNLTLTDADADNVSLTITYSPMNGTLTGAGIMGTAGNYSFPSDSLINVQNWLRTLLFTPTFAQVSVGNNVITAFSITSNDGTVNSTVHTSSQITVNNVNDAPTISGTPATSIAQGGTYSFTPVANDIDGDSLTFTIINKPSWLSFSTASGQLSGTPTNADVG
ncbi:MAG: hypothetical protein ACI9LM_003456, partial [Alteromonadaceae bacterium]